MLATSAAAADVRAASDTHTTVLSASTVATTATVLFGVCADWR